MTAKAKPTAVVEKETVRGPHAWNPTAKALSRWRNGHVSRYTFEGLPMLGVGLNGDAAFKESENT